ncbi:MAG: AraC family transcriptional regulator [Pseudomonadota bacterium]
MILAELDLLLRYCAVGVLVTLALSGARGGDVRRALALIGLSGSLVCYLLTSSPYVTWADGALSGFLNVGAAMAPAFLAWLMLEFTSDTLQKHWPVLGAALAGSLLSFLIPLHPVIATLRGLTVAAVYVALLVVIALGDRDDLVPARRILRRAILTTMLALGIAITTVEITFGDMPLPAVIYVLQAAAFLALGLAATVWITSASRDLWPVKPHSTASNPNPIDRAKVIAAMDGGLWRTEGLTVGQMAITLGMADHHLRRVINQDLGYRNFSTFLNSYRIAHARQRLTDPAGQKTTVLEIAYDSGFSSLSPFNKAFRDAEGCSPSAFRARNKAD